MIKHFWYYIIQGYVKIGLFFTLKKVKVFGKKNIPKKGAILFIGNHQNALIDALLIPTTNSRKTHFLARAGAFQNKLAAKILGTLNMHPAYRLRDGLRNMSKNLDVFKKCVKILHKKEAVEIFAEGEHHLERRIITLKKGFARILLATMEQYPDLEIQIVPVGLNYDTHIEFPCSCNIYYGKPIHANQYFDIKNPDLSFSEILKVVSDALKELTLHVDDENYDETIQKLEAAGVNYLDPKKATELLENIRNGNFIKKPKKKTINWFAPFHFLAKVNSIIPLLIWRKKIKGGIKDIIFTNTFRFALIATLFPLFYLIQAGIISFFFGSSVAIWYLVITILLGVITTKTSTPNL